MKYAKSDVEWHVGIQGMHLSAFWDYFGKEKEALIITITFLHCWI